MTIADSPSGRNSSESQGERVDGRGKGLFTYREAARYLGVSERKVQAEVAAGRIRKVSLAPPGARKGPARIRPADLDAYIESRVVEPVDRRPCT